jgi:RNA 2',3'-cyclic 3'-phosphodiesterase
VSDSTAAGEQPGKIRLFTAVDLAQAVKAGLDELVSKLKTGAVFTGAHPSWVRVESLHVTLVFLGWQEAQRIDAVKRAMDTVAPEIAAFRLTVSGVELFPSPKNPKVIAVNLGADVAALKNLQAKLAEACASEGFVIEERAFRPHITLARIKSSRGVAGLRDLVRNHSSFHAGTCSVEHMTLYQSHLRREGAEYTTLHQRQLAPK